MKIRPAMTAIAAVIALSSTPLFAQSADAPPADTPAPAADTTSTPVVADDPLAPAPAADTATTAEPVAAKATAKPAARKATTVKTTAKTTAVRSRPAPARVASAAPAVPAAPAVTMAPVAPPTESLPAQTEPIVPVAAAVAANTAPTPVEQPSAIETLATDNALPIAGAAGLGILALGGLGIASRRRRLRREAEEAEWQESIENTPAALGEDVVPEPAMAAEPQPGFMPEQTEPAFVRAFEPAPVAATAVAAEPTSGEPGEPIDGPTTDLPEGFDLSRFSPNMQAAYTGPTEDNPSLSLKHRLRRAAGMDQLAEREADPASPVEAPAAKPATTQQGKVDFMLAKSGKKPRMPAYNARVRPAYNN